MEEEDAVVGFAIGVGYAALIVAAALAIIWPIAGNWFDWFHMGQEMTQLDLCLLPAIAALGGAGWVLSRWWEKRRGRSIGLITGIIGFPFITAAVVVYNFITNMHFNS